MHITKRKVNEDLERKSDEDLQEYNKIFWKEVSTCRREDFV